MDASPLENIYCVRKPPLRSSPLERLLNRISTCVEYQVGGEVPTAQGYEGPKARGWGRRTVIEFSIFSQNRTQTLLLGSIL